MGMCIVTQVVIARTSLCDVRAITEYEKLV